MTRINIADFQLPVLLVRHEHAVSHTNNSNSGVDISFMDLAQSELINV